MFKKKEVELIPVGGRQVFGRIWRIDPLILAVFEKLPVEPSYPTAPLPPGTKPSFPDREEWMKLLEAALDVAYEKRNGP